MLSPAFKNGVVSAVLQKSTTYIHFIKSTKHQLESSRFCEGSENIRSWFMPLSGSWRIIFRTLSPIRSEPCLPSQTGMALKHTQLCMQNDSLHV